MKRANADVYAHLFVSRLWNVWYTHIHVCLKRCRVYVITQSFLIYSFLQGCVEGRLGNVDVKFDAEMSSVAVCLVSGGYPGSYPKGKVITGG